MKKKQQPKKINGQKRDLIFINECNDIPIKEVKELEELHYGTMMTTSTDNIYLNGHLLGALPWAQ